MWLSFASSQEPYKGSCTCFRTRLSNESIHVIFECAKKGRHFDICCLYADKTDIVDEAITFFRANVFFTNFDIKSPADKLLIYLTFYINVALKRLEGCRTLAVGTKAIINLGLEDIPVPGEAGFPFPGLFSLPQSQDEAGTCAAYHSKQFLLIPR